MNKSQNDQERYTNIAYSILRTLVEVGYDNLSYFSWMKDPKTQFLID